MQQHHGGRHLTHESLPYEVIVAKPCTEMPWLMSSLGGDSMHDRRVSSGDAATPWAASTEQHGASLVCAALDSLAMRWPAGYEYDDGFTESSMEMDAKL